MDTPDKPKPPRPTSEKRQRTKLTAHRWLTDEFSKASAKADKAGLTFGAYVRAAAVGEAGPRAQRSPTVNKELLIHVLGLHGQYGNNMNQIAHNGNAGFPVDLPELHRALKEWAEIRDALYLALGKTPKPEP